VSILDLQEMPVPVDDQDPAYAAASELSILACN
jgi:hypothetical protein